MNKEFKYGFIGTGNMAKAIIFGMLKKGISPVDIIASTKTKDSAEKLQQQFGIVTTTNNKDCLLAKRIILAVKPQVLSEVILEIKDVEIETKLFISVIAGVSSDYYQQMISKKLRLVRAMPNTPVLVGQGMTGLYATPSCNQEDLVIAENLFITIGQVLWVSLEEKINFINAISGSGPAYFFEFMRNIVEKGESLGLSKEEAIALTIQTAKGAAYLSEQTIDDYPNGFQGLIEQVCSKGGTTYEAIQSFRANHFDKVVDEGLEACYQRAISLGL